MPRNAFDELPQWLPVVRSLRPALRLGVKTYSSNSPGGPVEQCRLMTVPTTVPTHSISSPATSTAAGWEVAAAPLFRHRAASISGVRLPGPSSAGAADVLVMDKEVGEVHEVRTHPMPEEPHPVDRTEPGDEPREVYSEPISLYGVRQTAGRDPVERAKAKQVNVRLSMSGQVVVVSLGQCSAGPSSQGEHRASSVLARPTGHQPPRESTGDVPARQRAAACCRRDCTAASARSQASSVAAIQIGQFGAVLGQQRGRSGLVVGDAFDM